MSTDIEVVAANSKKSLFGVYIIEFLRPGDFKDGKHLNKILKLSKIRSVYRWVSSIEELERNLKKFKGSTYRYLHISCHGDMQGIEINNEQLSNQCFQTLIGNISGRRIFMSACETANNELASYLICKSQALSFVGTPVEVDFDVAAMVWPAFFHVMQKLDDRKMANEHLNATLKKCVELFRVPINCYFRIKNTTDHIRRIKIQLESGIDNKRLNAVNYLR